MALALAQGSNSTGTLSPATPGSLTTTAGNLLILVIAAVGTNPTIATPAGWTPLRNNAGATLSVATFIFPANTGGATNPSSALGGTVTGWGAAMFEFSGQGAASQYETLVGSAILTSAVTGLSNVFPSGQNIPQSNMLWFYTVARATATLATANGGLNWSASQQAVNANGVQIDSFWATNPGPGPFPSGAGTLGGAVASNQVGAWFSSILAGVIDQTIVGGNAGVYVPVFHQGMIGG